jgi:hypothetical protein
MVELPRPEISGDGAASREVISPVEPEAEEAVDRAFSREEYQLGTSTAYRSEGGGFAETSSARRVTRYCSEFWASG